jgi:hypothetical protein
MCVLLVKRVTWVLCLVYGTTKNVSDKCFVHIHHRNIYFKFIQNSQQNILILNFGLFMAVYLSVKITCLARQVDLNS